VDREIHVVPCVSRGLQKKCTPLTELRIWMNIDLKPANIEDVVLMDKLNREALPENYNIEEWKSVFKSFPKMSYCAWHGDKLVGYVLVMASGSFFSFSSEAHIASFAVDAKYRKRGIGKSLLRACMLNLHNLNYSRVTLNVRVDNEPAIAVYKSLNFVVDYEERGYYSDGTNAYNMRANLNNFNR
jgi:ribosomal protein S18 acetylase RimI-like enzyme